MFDPAESAAFCRLDYDNSDVNLCLLQAIPEMDDVANQQVAARRHLYFDPQAGEESLVVAHALDPIDSACFNADPVVRFLK